MTSFFRRLGASAVFFLVLAQATPALAAEEIDVARDINSQGFYVDSGAAIRDADISRLVEHASFEGEFVYFAVLDDNPSGGATFFADGVADRIDDGLLVVLTPESVGYGGNTTYSVSEIESALDTADAAGGNDLEYLTTFIEALTGTPVGDPVGSGAGSATTVASSGTAEPQPATSSSGGGNGFLWFLVIVAAVGLFLWWMMRRSKKRQAQPPAMNDRIVQARAVVQKQIDDVANDVLDLAEEVQVADNPQASQYYELASATYAAVSDEFADAKDPQSIIDLSQRLDEAIWQLDAAEAILDGNPIPPKPVKERVVIEPEPKLTTPQPQRPSYPTYDRRPTRRSSYGGSGLFDILIGVGSVLASTRGRRGGGGLFGGGSGGGLFGNRSQTTQPRRSTPAKKGSSGGGIFGRMGRVNTGKSSKPPSSRSSGRSSSRSSRSSRPRSRVRGGRRRRG
jgi:hypothetical protein